MIGQTSEQVAAWCDDMYWIKCDDGIHWTPLDVGDRMRLKEKILTQYVFYAYLFKRPGTIFYGTPQYVKETDYTSVT